MKNNFEFVEKYRGFIVAWNPNGKFDASLRKDDILLTRGGYAEILNEIDDYLNQ